MEAAYDVGLRTLKEVAEKDKPAYLQEQALVGNVHELEGKNA